MSKPQSDDKADAGGGVRADLSELETLIAELKTQYEQFFLGTVPLPPDRLHNRVKTMLRGMRNTPFKNSQMKYKLKTLEHRYSTYNTYWQRVLREKENGTYSRDVFKAELRERMAAEEAYAKTAKGAAEKGLRGLFESYKSALEQQSGRSQKLDFDSFKKSVVKRSKDFKEQHQGQRVAFKVVVKEGKVALQLVPKPK